MKKHKNYLYFIALIFALQILAGCSDKSSSTPPVSSSSDIESGLNTQPLSSSQSPSVSSDINSSSDTVPSLHIGSGCIGCGKCVNFDPEHFGYGSGRHNIVVLSQNNLDSHSLQSARRVCPVDAINIS